MAIAQDTFNQYREIGFNGQVSTIDVAEIISGAMMAPVMFGRAVIRGDAERVFNVVDATTTADDIVGITVRSLATESYTYPYTPDGNTFGYRTGKHASALRRGRMYATCIGGAEAGDTVHVVISGEDEDIGALAGAADGENTVELNQVKWLYDVEDGAIGEIELDGILNVTAAPAA